MTQGKLSKEEAQSCYEATEEIMKAFPKSKALDFIGHFNDIMLFLGTAKRELPSEKQKEVSSVSSQD